MNRRRHAVIMARPAMCGSLPPRKLLCACLVALLGGFAGSVWSAEQPATVQCDSDSCATDGRTIIKLVARGETQSADANTSGQMYPDQSLYAVDSVPTLAARASCSSART